MMMRTLSWFRSAIWILFSVSILLNQSYIVFFGCGVSLKRCYFWAWAWSKFQGPTRIQQRPTWDLLNLWHPQLVNFLRRSNVSLWKEKHNISAWQQWRRLPKCCRGFKETGAEMKCFHWRRLSLIARVPGPSSEGGIQNTGPECLTGLKETVAQMKHFRQWLKWGFSKEAVEDK